MTTPRPALGVAMVLGSGALFAVNGTVSKLVLRAGLNAQQLTLLRALGAVAGLLLLSLLLRPGARRLRVTPRQIPLLVAYGLTGFFLVPMLYFVAISRLPVGLGLLFEYSAPLLVALWARFGQRHRVRPRLWAGLALSLAGLGCVAEVWGELKLDGLGMLAGLGAAVFLAVYYVLGARGVQGRDALSLCTWAFGASAVAGLLTRVAAGTGGWEPLTGSAAGVPVALLCGYVVVLGSIVPYLLVAGAMRHLPATSVGIVGMVEPVLAAAVAWMVIGDGETLNAAQLGGGALVLLGVALAETARVSTPRATAPPAPDTVPLGTAPPTRPVGGPTRSRVAGKRGRQCRQDAALRASGQRTGGNERA
ncbi:EamA family transporter [Micromonospora rubida]|uniref:EamA family transporter n=1 Tax=Micromonospora rubida TaxID=2697657 RepID=UPI0013786B90|nr:EamA family transporter [Micromonospora rubida]NBE83775.1 EamA family transporter [Micromonospora rubida]